MILFSCPDQDRIGYNRCDNIGNQRNETDVHRKRKIAERHEMERL